MSILIEFNKNNPDEWVAVGQYFEGIDNLPQSLHDRGYLFSELPELEFRLGMNAILCCNPQTMELYYKYIPIPPEDEEELVVPQNEVQELKNRVMELEMAIAAILGGAV